MFHYATPVAIYGTLRLYTTETSSVLRSDSNRKSAYRCKNDELAEPNGAITDPRWLEPPGFCRTEKHELMDIPRSGEHPDSLDQPICGDRQFQNRPGACIDTGLLGGKLRIDTQRQRHVEISLRIDSRWIL